jgi:hypothetical protein
MEDAFIAFDTIAAFLLAASLAMVVFTHRELRVARLLLALCALVISVRWTMWAMTIEHPWWVRAVAGAILGAAILGGLPALWKWSKEKELAHSPSTVGAPAQPEQTASAGSLAAGSKVPSVEAVGSLHRHYSSMDRDRLSAVLFDLHTLLNETVMPAQLEVHQTLSEFPALVRSQGMQTAKARLSASRTVFTDARNDYIRRFKSGSHYYADEIEDITSNKDEMNAEIVALDRYIEVLSALPENAQQNLIELMKPYEVSLRDANGSLGNWVVRCNERIKAKRDALQ